MNSNRKPPQKFDSMWDLITELNAAGHPDENLWYKGDIRAGEELIFSPRYFLSAACRLIGQRNSDGKWTTIYGYDDPVSLGGPVPAGAHNLAEKKDTLEFFVHKDDGPVLANE